MEVKELVVGVVGWGRDRDLLSVDNRFQQICKSLEEWYELFCDINSGNDRRDSIGDIVVTLILSATQVGFDVGSIESFIKEKPRGELLKYDMFRLNSLSFLFYSTLCAMFCNFEKKFNKEIASSNYKNIFSVLNLIAEKSGANLRDCLALSFDEIKDRKGKTENGVFVKEN